MACSSYLFEDSLIQNIFVWTFEDHSWMGFHNCKGEVRKGTIEKENLVIFNLSTIRAAAAAILTVILSGLLYTEFLLLLVFVVIVNTTAPNIYNYPVNEWINEIQQFKFSTPKLTKDCMAA